jgi:hypothetical protein
VDGRCIDPRPYPEGEAEEFKFSILNRMLSLSHKTMHRSAAYSRLLISFYDTVYSRASTHISS